MFILSDYLARRGSEINLAARNGNILALKIMYYCRAIAQHPSSSSFVIAALEELTIQYDQEIKSKKIAS